MKRRQMTRSQVLWACAAFIGILLALPGCEGALWGHQGLLEPLPSLTPFQPEGYVPPTETVLPVPGEPTPTPVPPDLWISPAVPAALRDLALASGLPPAAASETAAARLEALTPGSPPGGGPTAVWVYALVAPFPTTTDNVSLADLRSAWAGTGSAGPFAGRPLWMDESTLAALSALWGAPGSGSVRLAVAGGLVDAAWVERPSWAVVPFEALEPRWKVLALDGQSPLHSDFEAEAYPLKVTFSLSAPLFPLTPTNRDPQKLTVVAMTGVTALVRVTADRMEKHGVLYPGRDVRDVLRAADVTHISNEVPFAEGCPPPDPWTTSLVFCSDPRYIALLEDVGTDVVELTGNHYQDWGSLAALRTIDMYEQRGWPYFGGGRDLEDSFQPALLTHNGNKLAFLGCNYAGPPGNWANETRPGSTPCDFARLGAEIARLRAEGYLPVMTFQYYEYYQPFSTPTQQTHFRQMAEAGAAIVSGSQSHVPAAMEFYGGSFVHYGLGNLFFDQMSYRLSDDTIIYDTRNIFIDRHVIYAGRHIGTELLTYLLEDYSRPRPMTEAERLRFLQYIFAAAGW